MYCPVCETNDYNKNLNMCLNCGYSDGEETIYKEYEDYPTVERILKK